MDRIRSHVDPDQMTSKERLDRLVELLVVAGLRLAEERKNKIKNAGGEQTNSGRLISD